MKTILGIKIGGLQQKIFNLVLLVVIAIIGAYIAVNAYQQNKLTRIVQETSVEQQEAIEAISAQTMAAVLETSMSRTTALQAYIANDLFSEVKTDVLTLRTVAEQLFLHIDSVSPHPYFLPDPAKDGTATVQVQTEKGVDPASSRSLGLVANMSEIMLAMFQNSDKLSSCFVATADGCILYVDDRSGAYFDENGDVVNFDVRCRPWYLQAAEDDDIIFTGVELDAFTDIPGLVCAAPVYLDGELVAVVGADIFLTAISDYVRDTASEGGFVCVVSGDGQVLFSPVSEGVFRAEVSEKATDLRNTGSEELAAFISLALRERTPLELINVDGRDYYLAGAPLETLGWTVVSVVEKKLTDQPTQAMLAQYDQINEKASAAYRQSTRRIFRASLGVTVFIVLAGLAAALILAVKVVKPLEKMTRRINSLHGDNAVFKVEDDYRTGDEIEILAESFATLTNRAQEYISQITRITAEKERIGTELALATRIQADMLPSIYPAFPDRSEFDIYAAMDPAKEVGGDFYDYFLVDDDHLCMVMADVSGKGVPAALFMMASKIILANNAMMKKSPAQILNDTNEAICSHNREEMFVTVWLGILEISTGRIVCANAGHEYPVIKHPDGQYELYNDPHGFVIGGLAGLKYTDYELQLKPGSRLFLYTDGVPEATDAGKKMFGTGRMLEALNGCASSSPRDILGAVRASVDGFVKEAEQFDDLTMLCLEYRGTSGKAGDA